MYERKVRETTLNLNNGQLPSIYNRPKKHRLVDSYRFDT